MPRETGKIHFRKFETSPQLQALWKHLSDGQEHTTRELSRNLEIYAVSTAICELRLNGYKVGHRQEGNIHYYQLTGFRSVMRRVCQYCKNQYGEKEGHGHTGDTHGICPECMPGAMESVRAARKNLAA